MDKIETNFATKLYSLREYICDALFYHVIRRQVRRTLSRIKFLVLAEEEVASGDWNRLQFSHSRSVAG